MRNVSLTVNEVPYELELDPRELRGSAEYRRHLVQVLVRRAAEEAMRR